MKNLPQGFISTILAQKKLSGNGNSNNGSIAVSDDYSFNPNIKELPSFNTPDNSKRDNEDYGLPLSTIAANFGSIPGWLSKVLLGIPVYRYY